MAITITARDGDPVMMGLDKRAVFTVALDSSYPAGGETFTPSALGFAYFDMVAAEPAMGYTFEYDHTNNKLKAFKNAPAIVIEEKHVCTDHTATLNYPAAWIMSVCEANTAKVWCKTGLTTAQLSSNQFCLATAIVDGQRTTIMNDGKTDTIYVTYITQAWDDLYACLVQEEAITTTAATDLTYAPIGFGYCELGTGMVLTPITATDTEASGEIGIDFATNFAAGTGSSALSFHTNQTPTAAVVTYLKSPPSGSFLYNRFVSDEDLSTGLLGSLSKPVAVWCCSGYGCTSASTINRMITRDGTLATGTFKVLWGQYATGSVTGRLQPVIGFGATTGKMHGLAYVTAMPWEIPTVPLEVCNGTDLSNVTDLRVTVYGR